MDHTEIKLIAFHLPQYHTFKENDEWWGEGFTEWVNVKKATPLYKNHNQPRVPLNDYYYNMLDEKTMHWQSELLETYGLYGFCYYHYWFDGHLLMERPVEQLLENKDIKQNYCFCWANEPWTRAWDGAQQDVLMPQSYGGEKEWEEHFQYLLPFFQDSRYIKVSNCPLFVLYRTESITDCDRMIDYWDKKCKENGFDGIHIVEEMNSFQSKGICKNSKGVLEFEPVYTMQYGRNVFQKAKDKIVKTIFDFLHGSNMRLYSYDTIWKDILKRKRSKDGIKERYLGAFVDWDNTARKGKKGAVFYGVSVKKFGKYFAKQIEIAKEEKSRFVFINAWNEWAEGTYLEPDTKNGNGYLQEIKNVIK